jgi:hypothetical protein
MSNQVTIDVKAVRDCAEAILSINNFDRVRYQTFVALVHLANCLEAINTRLEQIEARNQGKDKDND